MANILGRYGQAREDGYFKTEQEADIQTLRQKLVSEGKFIDGYLEADLKRCSSQDGDASSPVLMEVLQASSRVSVPDAARRRVWEIRRRAGLPPLPEEELLRAVRQLRVGAAAHLVPTGLSLDRSAAFRAATRAAPGPVRYQSRYELSPEQQALARRQLALGIRTAAYGTMAVVLTAGTGLTAWAVRNDVHDADSARRAMKAWGASVAGPIREAMLPWKHSLRAWVRGWVGDRGA